VPGSLIYGPMRIRDWSKRQKRAGKKWSENDPCLLCRKRQECLTLESTWTEGIELDHTRIKDGWRRVSKER
jgi:hypothetical protein